MVKSRTLILQETIHKQKTTLFHQRPDSTEVSSQQLPFYQFSYEKRGPDSGATFTCLRVMAGLR
ncbi:MAG: hypothetical protein ABIU05_18860, partial [Nitrospirales bacterium]